MFVEAKATMVDYTTTFKHHMAAQWARAMNKSNRGTAALPADPHAEQQRAGGPDADADDDADAAEDLKAFPAENLKILKSLTSAHTAESAINSLESLKDIVRNHFVCWQTIVLLANILDYKSTPNVNDPPRRLLKNRVADHPPLYVPPGDTTLVACVFFGQAASKLLELILTRRPKINAGIDTYIVELGVVLALIDWKSIRFTYRGMTGDQLVLTELVEAHIFGSILLAAVNICTSALDGSDSPDSPCISGTEMSASATAAIEEAVSDLFEGSKLDMGDDSESEATPPGKRARAKASDSDDECYAPIKKRR